MTSSSDEPGTDVTPAPAPVPMYRGYNPLMLAARFPKDLNDPRMLQQFVLVCQATRLNPLMLEIMPMHGRAYITEAGWQRLIDERAPGQLVYDEVHLGDDADKTRFGIKGNGWLAVATVRRYMPVTGKEREVVDWAWVSAASVHDSKVSAVKDEPWRQTMKTARLRALRKAFPEVLYVAIQDTPGIELEVFADDNSQDGGGDGMAQLEAKAKAKEDADVEAVIRACFWRMANKSGYRKGSQKLADLLGCEKDDNIGDVMKATSRTWAGLVALLEEKGIKR